MASTITRFRYHLENLYLGLHEERATKVHSRYCYQKWSSAWNPERVALHRIGMYKKPVQPIPDRLYNVIKIKGHLAKY